MTVTYPDVAPGTIGLTLIAGEVGKIIHFGQWLATKPLPLWLQRDDQPPYEHAFVYLGATDSYSEGAILEAEPGGSRVRSVNEYKTIYWCKSIAARYAPELPKVARIAPEYTGLPYSFLDYFSLFLHRLHLRLPFVKSYLAATGHDICSQLCDLVYDAAGAHLFTDRWAGDVIPMDLYLLDFQIENENLVAGS